MPVPIIIHLHCPDFTEPAILFENDDYAVCFKPTGMPTAPLKPNEPNTLLYFFLQQRPAAQEVRGGKKFIEHGLLHRLDTATTGLVMIAKRPQAYIALCTLHDKLYISKKYLAYCDGREFKGVIHEGSIIQSKFRPFGPGGKKVKPVFVADRTYKNTKGAIYSSQVLSMENYISDSVKKVTVCLTKGYRHQVRTHLASCQLPILGDRLYNPLAAPPTLPRLIGNGNLQLYAFSLTLPENIYCPAPDKAKQLSFCLDIL